MKKFVLNQEIIIMKMVILIGLKIQIYVGYKEWCREI